MKLRTPEEIDADIARLNLDYDAEPIYQLSMGKNLWLDITKDEYLSFLNAKTRKVRTLRAND